MYDDRSQGCPDPFGLIVAHGRLTFEGSEKYSHRVPPQTGFNHAVNPIQSGDPPVASGAGAKSIRTLPRPDSPKLLKSKEAKRALPFVLPALLIWLFSGLAFWVVGYTAAIVANISIGFILGVLAVVGQRRLSDAFRGKRAAAKVSVLEFTPEAWRVSRSDGSGAHGPMTSGMGVRVTKQEIWFWAGAEDPWLLSATDLENPADWPILVEQMVSAGLMRQEQKQRALNLR